MLLSEIDFRTQKRKYKLLVFQSFLNSPLITDRTRSMEQMFACARAREEPGSNSWWGSKEKLDMGIVQDQHGTQRFSVCAEPPVEYKPNRPESDESVIGTETGTI